MADRLSQIRERVTLLESVADEGEVVAYRVADEDMAWLIARAEAAERMEEVLRDLSHLGPGHLGSYTLWARLADLRASLVEVPRE